MGTQKNRLFKTVLLSTQNTLFELMDMIIITILRLPRCIAQSVTYLATDASLIADPGAMSSIPARSHTFMKIDHEITSMVILSPSAESFKKGCCQLQVKVCAGSTC